MPIDLNDVKKLREFSVLGSQSERVKNLLEEREGLVERNRQNDMRISDIDAEVVSVENRFRSIAQGMREVLDKLDPPTPPGPP